MARHRHVILLLLALIAIIFAVTMAKLLYLFQGSDVTGSQSPEPTAAVKTETREICNIETPCMWVVYTRFTRIIEYNMSRHCVCPPEKECLYYDDDISINAYEYRCYPLD